MSKGIKLHLPAGRIRVLSNRARRKSEPQMVGARENPERAEVDNEPTQFDGASLLRSTLDEVEDRLKAEYKAGFDEGRRHTEKHLRDDLAAKLADVERRSVALNANIAKEYEQFQSSAERNVVRLALAIAEKIVKREVVMDSEFLVRQIHEATKRIVGVERIKIRVNPNDESLVRQHRVEIAANADGARELLVEGDETIERGGCIVESESGNVDALIATQLEKIEDALLSGNQK